MSESTLSSQQSNDVKSQMESNRSNNKSTELGVHLILRKSFDEFSKASDLKSLLPISVLLDEMKSDFSSTRTYCLQNLSTIALALGPARARGLLGGFISNLLKDQDEGVEDVPEELKVMLTLLESLPKLIPLIGGPENSLVLLNPLLETLPFRYKEETKTMYLKVIKEISSKMFENHRELIESTLIKSIQEFLQVQSKALQAAPDSLMAQQEAALSLITYHYMIVQPDLLQQFLSIFKQLMLSPETQLRKKVVLSLKDFIQNAITVDDLQLCSSLIFEILTNGKDFKSNLYYSLPHLLKHKQFTKLPKNSFSQLFEQLNTSMVNIPSYNVFLENLPESLLSNNPKEVNQQLLEYYFKLFNQNELEIKQKICAMIGKVTIFIIESSLKQYVTKIQSYFEEQKQTENFIIKQNLIDSLSLILSACVQKPQYYTSNDYTIYSKYMLHLLQNCDVDIKFKFLQKQKDLVVFFKTDPTQLEQWKNIILALAQCKVWRMRQQCMTSLMIFLQNSDYNNFETIAPILKTLIADRIAQIRQDASRLLNYIFQRLNRKQDKAIMVFNEVSELIAHPNYLVRGQFVLGLREAMFLGSPVIGVLKHVKNDVPNVQLALLEVLVNQKQKYPEIYPESTDPDVASVLKYL